MKTNLQITNIIKALLTLTGKTPYQLAKHLEINHSSVGYWLREQALPTTERLPGIAEFFNVPLEYLFSETAPKTKDEIPFIEKEKKEDAVTEKKTSGLTLADTGKEYNPKIAGYTIEVPMTKDRREELMEIFISLEPKGQHLVIAEAYSQLFLQRKQEKEDT